MHLLAVAPLFLGFAFSATTSDSGWALQTFVTEPDINPPVFDINKTGTTADVSGLMQISVIDSLKDCSKGRTSWHCFSKWHLCYLLTMADK